MEIIDKKIQQVLMKERIFTAQHLNGHLRGNIGIHYNWRLYMEGMQDKFFFGRELNGRLRKDRESKIVGIINFKK